jgi:hypothetical protein
MSLAEVKYGMKRHHRIFRPVDQICALQHATITTARLSSGAQGTQSHGRCGWKNEGFHALLDP